ncbi:MAG: Ig-like domain-containing protein, partial [Erysipelotrichaceae bacterium]|nr:Ig-like domain-containing protein [Erysipelotrichaceae bacterium]
MEYSVNRCNDYFGGDFAIEIPGDIYVTDIGLEQGSVTIDESTQYQIISAPYPESDQSLIYEFADDITGENHNISFDKTEHMKWSLAKDEENGSYRIMLNDFLSKAGDLYLKYDDGFVLDGYDEENKDAYKFSFYKWDGIIPEGDPPAQEEPSPEEGEPSTGEEEPVEPEVKYLNFVLSDSLDCGDEVLIYHPSSGRCLAYGHTDYKANGFPETPDENNTIAIGLGTLDQSLMEWGVNINEDGSYSFLRGEWSYTENEDGTRTLAEVSGCLGGSEVVSVDTNGMIEPISIGSADIYVYSEDRGVYSIFTANVKEEVKLTSIDASVEKDRLNVGESIRVSYKLEPSETTNKSVYFTSSDESVATVDSIGRITALSPGNTAIKVTSSKDEQIYDTVDITVIKQVENMYYSETTYMTNLDKEDGHDFYPEIYPSDYTESLIWTSSNPEIAYVDNETGELVKTKNGTAKLKVMSECSGLSSEIFVGVSDFESDAMLVKMQSIYCSGGIFYIFALFDNGELWTWGGDRYTTPVRINCGDRFIKDFAVQNYLYILDQDGTV